MLRLFSAAALATLLAVLISACGDDDGAAPTTSPPNVAQELRANLGAKPNTLDPQLATALHELSVIREVFQGLLGFNSDLSLKPVVATEVPAVDNGGISADSLTYTFKLRDDVTWSDGEQVTAGDFAYAIKRLLDPDVAAPQSFHYAVIKGGQEYLMAVGADAQTKQALRDAVAVEALDEHSLRITLAIPNPTFLHKMALVTVYPVRQDIVEQSGAQWTEAGNYLGNGPYVMSEWVHQDHITLEANPNYWGPKPKLDRITYRMMADPNAELAAYRNDELDLSRVPPGTERAILADPVLSQEVVRVSSLFTMGLFFNTAAAPFDNAIVRQAFATAIDRDTWIDQIANGVGKPATSWLPPGMPGYDPQLGNEYAFNSERAGQLLARAGFPGGQGFPTVSFTFVNQPGERIIAEFIQAQMRDNLGVELNLDPLDPPAFFQQVMGARQFQLTSLGWGAAYPDPESFLAPLFMSGSPNNIGQYSNPEFDQTAGMASMEPDQQNRLGTWTRAHEILTNDAPIAPFFYQERFFLKKPKVQGLTLTAIDGAIPGDTRLADVSIAP